MLTLARAMGLTLDSYGAGSSLPALWTFEVRLHGLSSETAYAYAVDIAVIDIQVDPAEYRLLQILRRPFDDQPEFAAYAESFRRVAPERFVRLLDESMNHPSALGARSARGRGGRASAASARRPART